MKTDDNGKFDEMGNSRLASRVCELERSWARKCNHGDVVLLNETFVDEAGGCTRVNECLTFDELIG